MSISYGFYDSLPNDIREYSAKEFSSLFDGLINDGVFMDVGNQFMITASSNMFIVVGTGRAWFNHTWTYNDAPFVLKVSEANSVFSRIDTVILEVDDRIDKRINSVKILEGVPAPDPVAKTLTRIDGVYQYPLAYILVEADVKEITQSVITNAVGTSDCPFVTGIIQTMNIDNLISQWRDQWERYKEKVISLTGNQPIINLTNAVVDLEARLDGLKFVRCTKEEYDLMGPGRDPNTLFIYTL